jgi:hypothetical protein
MGECEGCSMRGCCSRAVYGVAAVVLFAGVAVGRRGGVLYICYDRWSGRGGPLYMYFMSVYGRGADGRGKLV